MITALVSTARASWMMGIFRASHDDRFHKTPGEKSRETGGENQCRKKNRQKQRRQTGGETDKKTNH